MKRLSRIIPHLSIVLAGMFTVFWILDIINPTMKFTSRKLSYKLLIVFCVLSIISSVIAVYYERKSRRNEKKDTE
ncbi:MAG: hypothetical protein IJ871_01835 [Ruminococcus sp.]|nr:hypothetical protein [Ruminococcus sp.]MBR2303865.1 hypothetical protein [Ruminococcus sp.]